MTEQTGTGLSKIQFKSFEEYKRLEPIIDLVDKCYKKWRDKNKYASHHEYYEIFDSVLKTGKDGLRAIFILMRGGKGSFLYQIINQLIDSEHMEEIVIPEEEYGRIKLINERYIAWADKHLPPSPVELLLSSILAEEEGDERLWYVICPSITTNYGGTYFSGTLKQAEEHHKRAANLRKRAVEMIVEQKDQWEV